MKEVSRMLVLAFLATLLVSCEKEKENEEPDTNSGATVEALVLNEGSWGSNNASITALNVAHGEVVASDWFSAKNGRGLGDVGQDMLKYGSKIYATVTFSNSLEVIDAKTGVSQRIDMGSQGDASWLKSQPRYLAAEGGKIYVTCYYPCSVVRIDTATLAIEATCNLGAFRPEGIAISNGKAFVASSFISDNTGSIYYYDDKVYAIDLANFSDTTAISVGYNPQEIKVIADGKLIVNYWGDYGNETAGSAIIDANTLAVTQTGQALTKMDVYNGKAYGYATEYDDNWNQTVSYKTIDANGTVSNFPFTFSITENPYGITINPYDGDIFVMTDGNYSANGSVFCYTATGELRFMLEAGMLPKKVVFL